MENTLPTFEDVQTTDVILSVDNFETEVEETEVIETDVEQTSSEETSVEVDPLAQATYESLVEKGLLEEDESFNGTFEYIDEKLEGLPSKLLKSAIDDLPEHSQSVLKYIATAGTNLTTDELKTFMKEYLGEQDVPDVTSLDTARSFMEDHLRSQGLREKAIQAQLDDLEDSDELISEAEKLIKSREKKTETLIQNKEQENQQLIQDQKAFVTSVNTTLTETGWSKTQQDKVRQIIPKTNEVLNQIVKSPKAYVQLMDLLTKFNGTEFDLEDYKKQGEARTASTIKDKITKSGFTSTGSKTKTSTDAPAHDIWKEFKPIV